MKRPAAWSWGDSPERVRAVLERGGIVAIPTESSYGLAVDPRNEAAVDAVFRIKGRSGSKALPVVAADQEQLLGLGLRVDSPCWQWAARQWPAPLTVVIPLDHPIAAAAGGDTLAVRIPRHERLRCLLSETGPVTATSANRSGEAPLLEPASAAELLAGEDALVVDDGPLAGGPPSTIVRADPDGWPVVVRQGRYAVDEQALGRLGEEVSAAAVEISAEAEEAISAARRPLQNA